MSSEQGERRPQSQASNIGTSSQMKAESVNSSMLLSVTAVGCYYENEGDSQRRRQTARILLHFKIKGITKTEDIAGVNIDFGINAEGNYDVCIDTINPDRSAAVMYGPYTILHEAERGLSCSIPTPLGPITLGDTKYTRQWTWMGGKRVDFTIDRSRRRAKVQLINPDSARIPRDYRILVKIVKVGGQSEPRSSTGVSGGTDPPPAAFPFTLTVFGNTKIVVWKNMVERLSATWRLGSKFPDTSFRFSEDNNEEEVLAVDGNLGLVEALRSTNDLELADPCWKGGHDAGGA